jgi:hypothetical protein
MHDSFPKVNRDEWRQMLNSIRMFAASGLFACVAFISPALALPTSPAILTAPIGRELVQPAAHKPPFKKKSAHSKEKHARHKAERRDRERRDYERSRRGVHLHMGDDRDRRYWNDRYPGAPFGWWRYHDRPRDWKKRGCTLIGPDWFCPPR